MKLSIRRPAELKNFREFMECKCADQFIEIKLVHSQRKRPKDINICKYLHFGPSNLELSRRKPMAVQHGMLLHHPLVHHYVVSNCITKLNIWVLSFTYFEPFSYEKRNEIPKAESFEGNMYYNLLQQS